MVASSDLVPPAGIEPALLSEPDFESGASTNSAKGAHPAYRSERRDYSQGFCAVKRFFQLFMFSIDQTVK